jgi:hypothetical protein
MLLKGGKITLIKNALVCPFFFFFFKIVYKLLWKETVLKVGRRLERLRQEINILGV